jgi:hypothetical protein
LAKKQAPKSLVDTISYDITMEQSYDIKEWMEKQIGKKYDYWGVLLMCGRPKKYKKDDRWFCSEFASE